MRAGAAILMSQATLPRLAAQLERTLLKLPSVGGKQAGRSDHECVDIETQSEDYHTAVCLHHAGIHANVTLSRDDKNREYFQIFTASSHYRSLGFSPEMWFWKGKGFDRDTANRHQNCCAEWPVVFHRYRDMEAFHELYEGEGATLPNGAFNTSRLHLLNIVAVEAAQALKRQGAGAYQVSHGINRIHFPPPSSPPAAPPAAPPPPATPGVVTDHDLMGVPADACLVRVGWCHVAKPSQQHVPKEMVYALMNATFPDCYLALVKLNENGLWVDPAKPAAPPTMREDLDVLMCLGWHYDTAILAHRAKLAAEHGTAGAPQGVKKNTWEGQDVFWPLRAHTYLPHTKGRPFLISFNTEPTSARGPCIHRRSIGKGWTAQEAAALVYDVTIDVKRSDSGHHCSNMPSLYWPLASRAFYNPFFRSRWYHAAATPEDLMAPMAPAVPKAKACAWAAPKCDGSTQLGWAVFTALFDVLSAQDHACDAIDACRAETADSGKSGAYQGDELDTREVLPPYKLTLVSEPWWVDGFLSERLVQALLAGTVPVYAGVDAGMLGRSVNLERLVLCEGLGAGKKFQAFLVAHPRADDDMDAESRVQAAKAFFAPELRECAERVQALLGDPSAYAAKLAQPALPSGGLDGTVFDVRTVAAALRNLLADYNSYLVQ